MRRGRRFLLFSGNMAGDEPLFSGTSVNIFDIQQTNGTRNVEINITSGPLVPALVGT